MIRENRYIVLKKTDLEKIFDIVEFHGFQNMMDTMNLEMMERGIKERNYVVVEDDWPEYEKVWKMIEDRVDD